MFEHRSAGRNEILSKASAEHRPLSAAPDLLVGRHFFCYPGGRTESLQFKQMNDNQARMLPPPERSLAVSFHRRAKTFAPIVAVALGFRPASRWPTSLRRK